MHCRLNYRDTGCGTALTHDYLSMTNHASRIWTSGGMSVHVFGVMYRPAISEDRTSYRISCYDTVNFHTAAIAIHLERWYANPPYPCHSNNSLQILMDQR